MINLWWCGNVQFGGQKETILEDSKVNDSQEIKSDLSFYNSIYLNVKFAKAFLFRFPGRFVQIEAFEILNNIFFSFETERQSDNRNDVMDISKG